jgi:hypothetical protein
MNRIKSETLVDGIMEFINSNVIPSVDDTFLKIAMKTAIITAAANKDAYVKMVDGYLDTDFFSTLLKRDSEGYFEIESLIDAIRQAMNECGELKITFPAIKFLSPTEKVLIFKANDITALKQYITNAASKTGGNS